MPRDILVQSDRQTMKQLPTVTFDVLLIGWPRCNESISTKVDKENIIIYIYAYINAYL